jgi:hypothetical protein
MDRMRKDSEILEKSIRAVEENHWLLVFPIPKKNDPMSLWHVLYPKTVLRGRGSLARAVRF